MALRSLAISGGILGPFRVETPGTTVFCLLTGAILGVGDGGSHEALVLGTGNYVMVTGVGLEGAVKESLQFESGSRAPELEVAQPQFAMRRAERPGEIGRAHRSPPESW